MKFRNLLIVCVALCPWGCNQKDGVTSRIKAAEKGLSADKEFQITLEDSCPVCGMRVSDYEKYACGIQLQDGRFFYTCGTECLVRVFLDPETHLAVSSTHCERFYVQEFFSGEVVDVRETSMVAGSDFIGPMGRTVAPVDPDHVDVFIRRHGGNRVFQLTELTKEEWKSLSRKP